MAAPADRVVQLPKAGRVAIGLMLMAAFVLISWSVLTRYAGAWGVPYFTFQTERGSACTNGITGYTCSPVTLPDITFYGDVALPAGTRVVSSRYHATHDYQLGAQLLVPRARADAAFRSLADSFGRCQPGHPAPMPTNGLSHVCVFANDDSIADDVDAGSRLYTVGTALRPDGARVITLDIKSR